MSRRFSGGWRCRRRVRLSKPKRSGARKYRRFRLREFRFRQVLPALHRRHQAWAVVVAEPRVEAPLTKTAGSNFKVQGPEVQSHKRKRVLWPPVTLDFGHWILDWSHDRSHEHRAVDPQSVAGASDSRSCRPRAAERL